MSSKGSRWSSCLSGYGHTLLSQEGMSETWKFFQRCCCDLTAYRLMKLLTFRANLDYLTLKALYSFETSANISRHGMTIHKYWIFQSFNYSVYCTSPQCLGFVFVSTDDTHSFIHLVVCLTTGPKPLPKRALHIVRSRASSFNWEHALLSLRSSNSFVRLLPCLPVASISPCIFPSITCCRRQFLRKMWPIKFACVFHVGHSSAPWL